MTTLENQRLIESRFGHVKLAAARLEDVANRTPVMRSRTLDQRLASNLYLKCENFQRMGAFKFRGAYNAMRAYVERQQQLGAPVRGVITHSSGNHAQAIALAGRLLGVPNKIVMPQDAPAVKLAATRGYGAQIVLYDRHKLDREQLSAEIAEAEQLELIPPFDHDDVIAGQGTAALELIEHCRGLGVELDALVVCLGGGGLLSGCAIAAKALQPAIRVYGVEPEAGNEGLLSLRSGQLVSINNPDTIADGARTGLSPRTFAIIQALVNDIVLVSDAELISAMKFAYERMKLVVEPTGVLALAACLQQRIPELAGKHIGVLISGGNVDLSLLSQWFAQVEAI